MATLLENPIHALGERDMPRDNYRLNTLTACSIGLQPRSQFRNAPRIVPAEVDFILSALDTALIASERRVAGRVVLRTLAELQLYSDKPGAKPWVIYSRDGTTRGLGFITRHRLPLGYGGLVQLRGPNGEDLSIACTIRRCHESVNGWFEGCLSFNREQWAFDGHNTSDAD